MATSAYNRLFVARAAAILTNAEVAAATFDINESAPAADLVVDVAFTLGSLTNVILRAYGSMDGVTWYPLAEGGASTPVAVTITANDTRYWSVKAPNGVKFFRVTAQGTGTVTSSSLALNYRYVRRGAR